MEESPSTTLSDSSHLFALTLTSSHSHSSAKNLILKLAPPAHTHTQHLTLTLTLPKKITKTKRLEFGWSLNYSSTTSCTSTSMLKTRLCLEFFQYTVRDRTEKQCDLIATRHDEDMKGTRRREGMKWVKKSLAPNFI